MEESTIPNLFTHHASHLIAHADRSIIIESLTTPSSCCATAEPPTSFSGGLSLSAAVGRPLALCYPLSALSCLPPNERTRKTLPRQRSLHAAVLHQRSAVLHATPLSAAALRPLIAPSHTIAGSSLTPLDKTPTLYSQIKEPYPAKSPLSPKIGKEDGTPDLPLALSPRRIVTAMLLHDAHWQPLFLQTAMPTTHLPPPAPISTGYKKGTPWQRKRGGRQCEKKGRCREKRKKEAL